MEFDLAADYVNEDEDNIPIIKLYRNAKHKRRRI